MKLTKSQLKQIIKEELNKVLKEDEWAATDKPEEEKREYNKKVALKRAVGEKLEVEAGGDWIYDDYTGWDDIDVFQPMKDLVAQLNAFITKNHLGESLADLGFKD